jgi:hypothetical protein
MASDESSNDDGGLPRHEKRKHFRGKPRPGRRMEVCYRVEGSSAPGVVAMTRNIGVGGAFIAAVAPPSVGTPLVIDVQVPGTTAPHSMRAEVRWVSGPNDDLGIGMGVKFVDVDIDILLELAEYFSTLAATEAPSP